MRKKNDKKISNNKSGTLSESESEILYLAKNFTETSSRYKHKV